MEMEPDENHLDNDSITSVEILLSVCAGIVVIEQESQKVRLVHYTTQEYFDKNGAKLFPNSQRDLTHTCLAYMSLDTFTGGALEWCDPYELRDIIFDNYLLLYATQNWGHHAREASFDMVVEQVIKFLDNERLVKAAIQAMDGWINGPPKSQKRIMSWIPESPEEYTMGVSIPPRLVVAAHFGMVDFVKLFLELGDDLNGMATNGDTNAWAGDWDRKTALLRAIEKNHLSVAKILEARYSLRDTKLSETKELLK